LGISSIPQAFPDLRLSNTDLMFSRWILSVMGVSEVIRFWSIKIVWSSVILLLSLFNDKCINSKNKMKGFWNCIKGHNYVTLRLKFLIPKITELLVDTGDINNALKSHFSSGGY
jgi:hypothetical protein